MAILYFLPFHHCCVATFTMLLCKTIEKIPLVSYYEL